MFVVNLFSLFMVVFFLFDMGVSRFGLSQNESLSLVFICTIIFMFSLGGYRYEMDV